MVREYNTINEAAHLWVGEFNAIPQGMIAKLMQADPEDWHEVTLLSSGDRVYVYNLPDEVDTLEHGGELQSYDEETDLWCVKLDDGIDGAGYDFYEAHWEPLYKARGLHWHSEEAEHDYQMQRKGYERKMYCGKVWWCNGNDPIEEVRT